MLTDNMKNFIFFILFVSLFLLYATWAQDMILDGSNITNPTPNYDYTSGVAIDSSDNIIVIGRERPVYSNKNAWRIINFNPDVDFIKKFVIDPNVTDQDEPTDVAVDSSDNIIVVGYDTLEGFNNLQWRIMKFDSDLNLIDQNLTNPSIYEDAASGVAIDSHDNIIVVGRDRTNGDEDQWRIIKYDSDLNQLHEYKIDPNPNPNKNDFTKGVAIEVRS